MPHLPGTPRPASSLPPGSVKATSTQARPSSPGNIRPVKREVKVEPEKKDPEKKVASEPSVKGKAPLGKVEEVTAEEGTPVEPTDPGESGPSGAGLWARGLCVYPLLTSFYLTFISFLTGYLNLIFSFSLLSSALSPLLSLLLVLSSTTLYYDFTV